MMTTDSKPTGVEAIRAALAHMPASPGVYQMRRADGEILYVGKARQLKNRVSNYASASGLTTRILSMVNQVAEVEIITTGSEAEALLLEANLIKKHSPRYNILLKDDKSFPYIMLQGDHPFPRIDKHRGTQKKPHRYFGPFASAGAVNQSLAILQRAFLLRPCSDSVFAGRTRPCLQYQIKRCSAPCVGYVSEADYAAQIDEAVAFLEGKSRDVQQRFAAQMQAHSEREEFEQAAAMRDRIRALTQIQQGQQLTAGYADHADVIALHQAEGRACVMVFFYRNGHHFGSQSYFPRHTDGETPGDVMTAFLGQFYQNHTPPQEILVNHLPSDASALADALAMRVQRRVSLHQPQRGKKRELVQQAQLAVEQALTRHLTARAQDHQHLVALADLLGMAEAPKRVEVYDNSHIMGRDALGAMIVAGPEGFDKSFYRRFNIKDVTTQPGDDYAMMREVFSRRFGKLQRDDPDRTHGIWPDLVLIDGGLGQLNAVREVLEELGVNDLTYCAIAKGPDRNAGRETFFLPDKQPFTLPPDAPLMHYLQRLRDEAHRFAIGSHRIKRAKSITRSALDDIPGIGTARKRALMHHFGSKKAIENATLAELEKVEGISGTIARQIYDYFHG